MTIKDLKSLNIGDELTLYKVKGYKIIKISGKISSKDNIRIEIQMYDRLKRPYMFLDINYNRANENENFYNDTRWDDTTQFYFDEKAVFDFIINKIKNAQRKLKSEQQRLNTKLLTIQKEFYYGK